ncbi:hypothetical protein HGM15179_000536 [Zosterops borbonicus]|uniref:Uncharacterized protein n=1 Tax=Zosterops borbonicus TaxID=364589 RepID=A0A8K1GWB3_9PASS|nr:hypothetical protein HGM15179_000536 [Zosterops borbonicus]
MESSPGEKNLLVDERLDMTQPCALTAQRDKGVLGCLQSSVASRAREGILSLCSSLGNFKDTQVFKDSLGVSLFLRGPGGNLTAGIPWMVLITTNNSWVAISEMKLPSGCEEVEDVELLSMEADMGK